MSSNQGLYPATSPYTDTNVVANKFLDVMNYTPIPMNPSDVYYTITNVYQYRPDLLAYDLYGDAALWWVFTQRNLDVIQDPIFDFVPGTQIYIPKGNSLKTILGL